MIRFCAIVGLATCVAAVGAVRAAASAAASELGRPMAARGDRPLIGNPLWAVPLRSLSATRERPIFSPSRRPQPPAVVASVNVSPAAPPKPDEPAHPPLTLVGTIIGDDNGIGVFVDPATSSVVRLRIGQEHGGWTLRTVRGRDAMFAKDRRTATLSLPPPGAEAPTQPGIAVPVIPMTGTWLDGDGQMIAPPPRKAAQTFGLPTPAGGAIGRSAVGQR